MKVGISRVSLVAKLFITLYLLFSTHVVRAEAPPGGYSFGIGPQQSASELAKRWAPIIQYISDKSGVPLQFKTAKDIPTFQQQMGEGVFDIAYVNPYHYLIYRKGSHAYNAFAHEKDGKLVGVLVVKKGGPISNVSQLKDMTLAFPAANALAATWLPMHMLNEKGIAVTPQYVTSMDSVYRSVAKGLYPAGGGETRTLSTIDAEVRSQLEVLWTSEGLPPFPFAAHKRVPKDVLEKLQKVMAEMHADTYGLELLKVINFKGMEIADDADYNAMRKMNIKPVVEAK